MESALSIIILIGVLLLAVIYLPRFFIKRAVRKVVAIFRAHGATSPDTAVSLAELGLAPRSPFDRMFRMRDYKPYATRLLGQAEIIRSTEEGLVYLSEDDLERSPVKRFAGLE